MFVKQSLCCEKIGFYAAATLASRIAFSFVCYACVPQTVFQRNTNLHKVSFNQSRRAHKHETNPIKIPRYFHIHHSSKLIRRLIIVSVLRQLHPSSNFTHSSRRHSKHFKLVNKTKENGAALNRFPATTPHFRTPLLPGNVSQSRQAT